MEKWRKIYEKLIRNKIYMAALCLTAVFSYGFLVTHQTVGIDDTPYRYYFEDGLVAIVGRWFLFLLNKFFHIAEFTPFLTDLAGVLILMAAVTVWCALFYSLWGGRIPVWGYLFFSCIFLSCPLISEVYTYYLHNGVSFGYLWTGISLCFYRELTEGGGTRKGDLKKGLGAAFFLFLALGCYESFMPVWLLGVFLIHLSKRYAQRGGKVFAPLCKGAAAALCAMVFRSLMIVAVRVVFRLGDMQGEAVQRSLTEMISWMKEPDAPALFLMALKRVYMMYGVFAYAYYPIFVFVLAAGTMLLCGIWHSIRKRDGWCILLTLASLAACFLLVPVEGKATLYRAAQFLPVVCGYGALLLCRAAAALKRLAEKRRKRGIRFLGKCVPMLAVFLLAGILWNQCFDMNEWFYIDYMKYQSARELAADIYGRLREDFDMSKPVVFTGNYRAPRSIIQKAYVSYGSETFYKMNRLASLLDEHLLEKYYRGDYGVWVAQTPDLSVIEWGINAFESDSELVRFFYMHGYDGIIANTDPERFEEALLYSMELPRFPAEGSIVDRGDYLIVHF